MCLIKELYLSFHPPFSSHPRILICAYNVIYKFLDREKNLFSLVLNAFFLFQRLKLTRNSNSILSPFAEALREIIGSKLLRKVCLKELISWDCRTAAFEDATISESSEKTRNMEKDRVQNSRPFFLILHLHINMIQHDFRNREIEHFLTRVRC